MTRTTYSWPCSPSSLSPFLIFSCNNKSTIIITLAFPQSLAPALACLRARDRARVPSHLSPPSSISRVRACVQCLLVIRERKRKRNTSRSVCSTGKYNTSSSLGQFASRFTKRCSVPSSRSEFCCSVQVWRERRWERKCAGKTRERERKEGASKGARGRNKHTEGDAVEDGRYKDLHHPYTCMLQILDACTLIHVCERVLYLFLSQHYHDARNMA